MGRKKGDVTALENLPNGSQTARKHGLAALRDKFYNADIEKLIDGTNLPDEMQRLINRRLMTFKEQTTYNEVTEGLFRRLAFKEAWCELAEQWFTSNKLSAFWIKDGQFVGSHLAFQYKIFSESLARDYEKLGLLPEKRKGFNKQDLVSLIAEIENE